MTKRIVLLALSACAGVGLLFSQHAASGPPDQALPVIPQLLGYTMTQLTVPQAAGQPFDLVVPLGDEQQILNLRPYTVRSPDFQLLVDPGDGQLVPHEPDPFTTYRGELAGVAGSWAAASLIEGKLRAMIYADGQGWSLEPMSDFVVVAGDSYVVYREQDSVPPDKVCGGAIPWNGVGGEVSNPAGGTVSGTGMEIIEIGCDSDLEYWLFNGQNIQNTMADIEGIINGVSALYEAQANITYEITTIIVRTGDDINDDPYSTNDCSGLLTQFANTWASAPEIAIKRDIAHLFTDRNLSGCLGIAFLGTVCSSPGGAGYGLVESHGVFSFARRVATSAHEIGHNFSAQHCCKDTCCNGCGGSCDTCHIMCPCISGCSGVVTAFGDSALNQILDFANGIFCLQPLPDPLVPPFFDNFPSTLVNLDNWIHIKDPPAHIGEINTDGANEPSPPFALHLNAAGSGLYDDEEIRTNFINLEGLENTGMLVQFNAQAQGVEAGELLTVEYWTNTSQRWKALATIVSDGTTETTFTEHTINLDGLDPTPFHETFRLRFAVDVDGTDDHWYVDDVYIGDTPPPTNDSCLTPLEVSEGSFPITTISASTDGFPTACSGGGGGTTFINDTWFRYTPSCTGDAVISLCNDADFDSRLALYFEGVCPPAGVLVCSDDAAGCGVTSEITQFVLPVITYLIRVGATSGGGTGTLTITCGDPCPWDLDGSGDVGITDFLELLAAWGPNPGHPADFDDSGDVGITDFLELLSNWGEC